MANSELETMPKLGFGLMRLPKKEGSEEIDVEIVKDMVDRFLAAGMRYFDTAYVYGNGDSEKAAREALVERYPREKFCLATKLHAALQCTDEASAKQEFYTSLARTGAGYFDFYLLHAITKDNLHFYNDYHLWDFVAEQKAKGLIRHVGFSFHDSPELLDRILAEHPEVEFVQLQLNYADWRDPRVQAEANYNTVRRHGKYVVVMEPVKGGTLAEPPKPIADLLHRADPKASLASWGIRFAASHEGILTVHSGMSNLEQMEDNLSYMQDFQPLTAAEETTLEQAQAILRKIPQIPCTGCSYCTGGCPKKIPIPDLFKAMNWHLIYGDDAWASEIYEEAMEDKEAGKPSECLHCRACERACPQHLPIPEYLKQCAAVLEKNGK